MEYVIIGGDERFAWLARLLAGRGEKVGTLGREKVDGIDELDAEDLARSSNVIVNEPPKLAGVGMSREALLSELPQSARVFCCGPAHPKAHGYVVDLWADEALLRQNAHLTAEGAVASAMRHGSLAIGDMCCMVVGWGRIGRALAELLVGLGARVIVATRSERKRNCAAERGAEGILLEEISERLPECQLVFNTAPATVLDGSALKCAHPEAMLVDLASPPYGIDLPAAWARGLRAWREPGLPGRYCPQSAALALLAALDRNREGGIRHE